MKNILFVCTGNSARSIIAEAIVNTYFKDKYKAFSAGSSPSGKINQDIKNYLLSKNMNVSDCYSKDFRFFLEEEIKMFYVVTVCNNANNELCPIWPKKNKIIHWDIEDPVIKLNQTNDINIKNNISEKAFKSIYKKIDELLN